MTNVTDKGGEGGDADSAYKRFWKFINVHYIADPNDDVVASIVENSFVNPYLLNTDEEQKLVELRKLCYRKEVALVSPS